MQLHTVFLIPKFVWAQTGVWEYVIVDVTQAIELLPLC
jgi:hypothetical protein